MTNKEPTSLKNDLVVVYNDNDHHQREFNKEEEEDMPEEPLKSPL